MPDSAMTDDTSIEAPSAAEDRLIDHLPTDPDVDLHDPRQREEWRHPWDVLAAISIGGALGALARYGVSIALPAAGSAFPWETFGVNVAGCLLIGVLMVLVTEVWTTRRLVRPFLGVGVLGGFTTFSTYIVDVQHLVSVDAATTALMYLLGTIVAALAAVHVGITVTSSAIRSARKARRP